MSGHWYTFEDVMEDDNEGYCRVSRAKLATCGFAQLAPGDIIGVTHTYEKRAGEYFSAGTLFVKVVSVRMPSAAGLFKRENPGNVVVQLPDGEITELLSWDPRSWPSGICYFPTAAIYEYFRENCEMDSSYVDLSRLVIYKGHEAELQADMLAEKERRKRVRTERIERYRREEEMRKAEEARQAEEQKRNTEAKEHLSDLFDSMDDVQFADHKCPKCGAPCSVPVRGKEVMIHCRCGFDFEVFC